MKIDGCKKIYNENYKYKKARITILTADKVEFNKKSIISDKKGNFIMIKGSIHQEAITIINVYVSDNKASDRHRIKRENRQIHNQSWRL